VQCYLLIIFFFDILLDSDVFLICFECLSDIVRFWCNHIFHDLQFDRLLFFHRYFVFSFVRLLFLNVLVVVKDIKIMALELKFD
jgi:hypothetical protein